MATDDGKVLRLALTLLLDGARPTRTLGWVSTLVPVAAQGAIGAGHWAGGRRRRALAAWASAAGYGLTAWGLGTEVPAGAGVENLLRELGAAAPAAGGTDAPAAPRRSEYTWLEDG